MCRVGDMEEKDLLFRAFIEQDEEFEYKKRGESETTKENIYQRVVRLCKNAKSRQDNQVKKLLPTLRKSVTNDENTVLFLKGNNIPSVFSGLIAMKMASYAKKPCLILRKDEENNVSKVFYDMKPNTKKIAMDVKIIQTNGAYSLLEIELITGRSHQLRAHLAFLGNPIIGDFKYGNKELNSFFDNKYGLNYQFLYAYKVNFKEVPEKFNYLKNKTIAEGLPPIFKRIKKDVFKFTI